MTTRRNRSYLKISPAAQAEIDELEKIFAIPFPAITSAKPVYPTKQQSPYAEVAESVGFYPAELTHSQLLEFFKKEGLKVFDYGQVAAWLTKRKERAEADKWCWRPLRQKDVITDYLWGRRPGNGFHQWHDGYYSSSMGECRPYELLVPIHVLEKIAKIEAVFGERVKFFVSDYVARKPDPFAMVKPAMRSGHGNPMIVFDFWDEPGFGT